MPRRKKSERTKLIERADKLCRQIILERDQSCKICGTTERLQWAHGFSRRYHHVRWDLRNSWALCARHHQYYTWHPLEWDELMRGALGLLGTTYAQYREVRELALSTDKIDYAAVVAALGTPGHRP